MIYVIKKDGVFFGATESEEAAWRDVDDNVDRLRPEDEVEAEYDRFTVGAYCYWHECTRPS